MTHPKTCSCQPGQVQLLLKLSPTSPPPPPDKHSSTDLSDQELSQWELLYTFSWFLDHPLSALSSELCQCKDLVCLLTSLRSLLHQKVVHMFRKQSWDSNSVLTFTIISLYEGLWILFGKTTQTKHYLPSLSISQGKSVMNLFPYPSFGSVDFFLQYWWRVFAVHCTYRLGAEKICLVKCRRQQCNTTASLWRAWCFLNWFLVPFTLHRGMAEKNVGSDVHKGTYRCHLQ